MKKIEKIMEILEARFGTGPNSLERAIQHTNESGEDSEKDPRSAIFYGLTQAFPATLHGEPIKNEELIGRTVQALVLHGDRTGQNLNPGEVKREITNYIHTSQMACHHDRGHPDTWKLEVEKKLYGSKIKRGAVGTVKVAGLFALANGLVLGGFELMCRLHEFRGSFTLIESLLRDYSSSSDLALQTFYAEITPVPHLIASLAAMSWIGFRYSTAKPEIPEENQLPKPRSFKENLYAVWSFFRNRPETFETIRGKYITKLHEEQLENKIM